jgi:cysteine-rich repeat protein
VNELGFYMVKRRLLIFVFGIFILISLMSFVLAHPVEDNFCGDGEVNQNFEECDYGLLNGFLCWANYGSSCEYCADTCKLKTITNYCSDGIKQVCEECDDGNLINNDGCSENCTIEIPEPIDFCGDGICNNDEDCSRCEIDCGVCFEPECKINSDCGGSYYEEKYCSAENIARDLITPVCNSGFCRNESATEIVEECEDYCKNGECKEEDNEKKSSLSGYKLVGDFCVNNWECPDWSGCNNGIRTRTCVDKNNCDREYNKPAESTGCTIISKSKLLVSEKNQKSIFPFIAIGVITFIVLLIILINLI